MMPGPHAFVAGPSARAGVVSSTALRVRFTALAGHRHLGARQITGGSTTGEWHLVLTDMATGQATVI
jgi:hypothetical protein